MPRDLKADLVTYQAMLDDDVTPYDEITDFTRELLPEAIGRAIDAEYELARCVSCNDGLKAQLNTLDEELARKHNLLNDYKLAKDKLQEENAKLTAQVAGLREALEKLARLGNEPHYGNSTGNEIAKQALTSPDPGEKIMRVVEAAKEAIKYGPEFRNKDRGALERALAALEEGEQ